MCIWLHIYFCGCTTVWVFMYLGTHILVCVCVQVHVHVRVCVCRVCIFMCMRMYTFVCVCGGCFGSVCGCVCVCVGYRFLLVKNWPPNFLFFCFVLFFFLEQTKASWPASPMNHLSGIQQCWRFQSGPLHWALFHVGPCICTTSTWQPGHTSLAWAIHFCLVSVKSTVQSSDKFKPPGLAYKLLFW